MFLLGSYTVELAISWDVFYRAWGMNGGGRAQGNSASRNHMPTPELTTHYTRNG
jgi:hypothetical protein